MKKLKKLSGKTLKFISGGFDVQSECTTLCSDGRIATVTCNGDCSSSHGNWAGCSDGSDTHYCSKPKNEIKNTDYN